MARAARRIPGFRTGVVFNSYKWAGQPYHKLMFPAAVNFDL